MGIIEWKEEYALGVPEIDAEHRDLIGLVNEAWELGGATGGRQHIEAFLGEVHARIAAHFALEEKAMRRSQYPEYIGHKADHERLLDEIVDLLDAVSAGAEFGRDAFSAMLEQWFGGHFRTFDARLHGALPG